MRWAREKPPLPAIGGVNIASLTPRRAGEVEVDLGAMLELVDFAGSSGVAGIVLFGSSGEFIHFTPAERSRFVALAAKRSRLPVIANVSHSTLDAALMMAEEAAGGGIAAVMIMPPYFYAYPADTVETFCLEFAAEAARWTRVILCDRACCAGALPMEMTQRLLESGLFSGVVACRASAPQISELIQLRQGGSLAVLTGSDRCFVAARKAGAAGVVSESAAAIPELLVSLDRAVQAGASRAIERLERYLCEFVDAADALPPLVAIREACSLRGLKTGPPAVPLAPAVARRCNDFREWFRDWLPSVQKESLSVPV